MRRVATTILITVASMAGCGAKAADGNIREHGCGFRDPAGNYGVGGALNAGHGQNTSLGATRPKYRTTSRQPLDLNGSRNANIVIH